MYIIHTKNKHHPHRALSLR